MAIAAGQRLLCRELLLLLLLDGLTSAGIKGRPPGFSLLVSCSRRLAEKRGLLVRLKWSKPVWNSGELVLGRRWPALAI